MGVPSQLAIIMLREHRLRTIAGTVLSIGRQTVHLSPEEAIRLVEHELGISVNIAPDALEIDTETIGGGGKSFITDRAFYRLFAPDIAYRCLDVTNYEGADIVADLCQPLPPSLEGIADFIVDGSSLDNVFDPAAAIRNLSRMLKPGGRTLHANRASRRHHVYVAFALSWFHDYYCINAFDDCQIYLAQWEGNSAAAGRWDFYRYSPVRDHGGRLAYFGQDRYYYPWREAHAVVLAEKGALSTWDQTPIQFEFRPGITRIEIDGGMEIAPLDLALSAAGPYVAYAARYFRSRREWLRPDEMIELPPEFLYYSPETPYCGSIEPVSRYLGKTPAAR